MEEIGTQNDKSCLSDPKTLTVSQEPYTQYIEYKQQWKPH